MNAKQPRNMAPSVRHRLSNHARQQGEDFQYILTRFGLERLLYRLSRSPHADTFVLKGAVLFQLWSDQPHRPTRDLDLLAQGEPSTERFEQLFRDVCAVPVEDDGLRFLGDSVRAEQIKEEDEYQGIRLRIDARLGNPRIPLQVDIGFGDVITPGPIDVLYPTLLVGDRILAQNPETGELAYKAVLQTTAGPPVGGLLTARVEGDEIEMTEGHVVWAINHGWRMAKHVTGGDRLHGLRGGVRFDGADPIPPAPQVYNLVVADFNTYFVGESGILVHDITYRKPTTAVVPGLVSDRGTFALGSAPGNLHRQFRRATVEFGR